MRTEVAVVLEEFVSEGRLWSAGDCEVLMARLAAESASTGDPLPARVARFVEAVVIRTRMGDVPRPLATQIEAIVYPRLWKVVEAVRDGLPAGEVRTRVEVMNRRLARLFAAEAA